MFHYKSSNQIEGEGALSIGEAISKCKNLTSFALNLGYILMFLNCLFIRINSENEIGATGVSQFSEEILKA